MIKAKNYLLGVAVLIVIVAAVFGGAVSERLFGFRILDRYFPVSQEASLLSDNVDQRILNEESVYVGVAEKLSPSVVTVGVIKTQTVVDFFEGQNPLDFFNRGFNSREEVIERDIGSGFIVSKDGLVVTNKHVVQDVQAKYRVIDQDDQIFEVEKIYRDPVNDLAILRISSEGKELVPVDLGESDGLKVGQIVIAIGTALGQYRHSVTTGVISGLGRGIVAGSVFEGYVEQLDNVIQTDAAINPGNSGGPLVNSLGQVIGVSVAVASGAENIGFAIPINVVKVTLDNFNQTGQFERPFLGVKYRLIGRDLALMNEVPQGAYVVEVVPNASADQAGVEAGDIITKMDSQQINEDNNLAKLISTKKIGDRLNITVWRSGEEKELSVTLEGSGD